jgi:hypothetical protein
MQVYENDGNGWHRTAPLTATPVLVRFEFIYVRRFDRFLAVLGVADSDHRRKVEMN